MIFWIKQKLFWHKYRFYRKDEMTRSLIKHRLLTRKIFREYKEFREKYDMVVADNVRMTLRISLLEGNILDIRRNLRQRITTPAKCQSKKVFYNVSSANQKLAIWRKKGPKEFANGRVYECNVCGWYHVTTDKETSNSDFYGLMVKA